jgi:dolichol-phosphate mannosyltransferase
VSKVLFGLQSPAAGADPSGEMPLAPRMSDAGAVSRPVFGDSVGVDLRPTFPSESDISEQMLVPARATSDEAEGAPSRDRPPEVSIILATLNERDNLPQLFGRIRALGLSSYELVIIDDGSTDGTREFVETTALRDARVRLILNPARQTLTIAHLQGILASRGRYVIAMDSDLQHPPEAIPQLLRRLRGGADLVIGSRYSRGGSVGDRPAFRGLMSRVASRIAQTVLPEARSVSDPISGFFGFRRAVFRPFDRHYRGYETVLFMLVMCDGRRVAEFGYEFQPRSSGNSKITQDFGFIQMFLTQVMFALRFRRRLLRPRRAARIGGFPVAAPPTVGLEAEGTSSKRRTGLLDGPT